MLYTIVAITERGKVAGLFAKTGGLRHTLAALGGITERRYTVP